MSLPKLCIHPRPRLGHDHDVLKLQVVVEFGLFFDRDGPVLRSFDQLRYTLLNSIRRMKCDHCLSCRTSGTHNDLAALGGEAALKHIAQTLNGADDGELFIEHSQSESLVFDDRRLRSASFDQGEGFGLRAVTGETAAYAHSSILDADSLKRAAETTPPRNGTAKTA